jgi:hypothetical protein
MNRDSNGPDVDSENHLSLGLSPEIMPLGSRAASDIAEDF